MFKAFGKHPFGKSLEKVKASAQYKDGSFQNLLPTATMTGDDYMVSILWKFINKPKNTKPPKPIPTIKTNLKALPTDKASIVWFGHSSYFIQVNEKKILVDPVFSGHASPFSSSAKSFAGADAYSVDDFPEIDVLVLTHDHYDHLDIATVTKLNPKVKSICTSLGVASHLIYWGIDESKIVELDWWQGQQTQGMNFTATPARHFSGRLFKRGQTLWSSFVLEVDGQRIFIGGDSGYDPSFKTIGEKFGSFDIAILECGQYNSNWAHIHMMPEETAQAAIDLNAKLLLPVHWSKFALSLHPWNEPIKRVTAKAGELNLPIVTPMIGEQVVLDESLPNKHWWLQLA